MRKRLFAVFMTAALVLSFSGCAGGSNGEKVKTVTHTLNISYNSDKYGSAWIEAIAASFEKTHADVEIKLNGDAQIDNKLTILLSAQSQSPDIIYVSKTNWKYYASKGYFANLNDLYNTVIDNGKRLSDKIQPELLDYCSSNGVYSIVPWGDGVSGLIYNSTMFKSNGWEVPKTVTELKLLMIQMKSKGIAPFAWSTDSISGWDDIVGEWWAQAEGMAGMKNYLKMDSSAVYSQTGRLKSLNVYQSIITDTQNSINNPLNIDDKKALSEFYDGKAAMMPPSYLNRIHQSRPPSGVEIKMMKLPDIDGAAQSDIEVSSAGGFAAIPSYSKNVLFAKEFLAYTAQDEMLEIFTQKTGEPCPYVYDAAGIIGLESLTKSVAEQWQNGALLYKYSKNPAYYNELFDWPFEGSPLLQIYFGNGTAQTAYDENAAYAFNNWSSIMARNSF